MGHEVSAHGRGSRRRCGPGAGEAGYRQSLSGLRHMHRLPQWQSRIAASRSRCLGVHRDGAMCEEILVPAANLYPAAGLSAEAAATVEFLAIGAHAVRRAQTPKGSRSLVIGAGPIGLGTALFSRIAGHDVTLLDMSRERLDFASRDLGFTSTIGAGGTCGGTGRRRHRGRGLRRRLRRNGQYDQSMQAAFRLRRRMAVRWCWSASCKRRHHLLRPGIPQARDDADRQPQRHAGGLRPCGCGDRRRQRADRQAGHPSHDPGAGHHTICRAGRRKRPAW